MYPTKVMKNASILVGVTFSSLPIAQTYSYLITGSGYRFGAQNDSKVDKKKSKLLNVMVVIVKE